MINDYIAAAEAIEELEKLLLDEPHGEREKIGDEIIDFVEKMKEKYKNKTIKEHKLNNTVVMLTNIRDWLQEQPFGNNHLSNLPTWFWEQFGETISDIEDYINNDKNCI